MKNVTKHGRKRTCSIKTYKGRISKELAELIKVSDVVSKGEYEHETMLRFRILVPYSDAPTLKLDIWKTEHIA